jgi:hypothetical protein
VVSGAELRGFRFSHSWYQVPAFVVSGSANKKSFHTNKGLQAIFKGVTLLNTDSNFFNTRAGLWIKHIGLDQNNGSRKKMALGKGMSPASSLQSTSRINRY